MEIVFSKHVLERILLRDINKETIIFIVQNPDFIEASFGNRKIAAKKLEKLWKVVFVEEEGIIFIITVFSGD